MNSFSKVESAILIFITLIIAEGCSTEKKQIARLDDAKKSKIGVMTGTTGEQLAHKNFPEATVKSFDDIMDAVGALKSDQISAVITAYPTAMNVCKRNKDLTIISEPVDYETTAIAVNKKNSELLNQLNKFITELTNNGILKDMKRRWFKTDLNPYETVNIQVPPSGKILKVGVSATREPFCFIDSNKNVTGHDGELARRAGAYLNRPVQFVDMKFSALVTALASGKIDVIISGMTATEERKKSVDFTEMYFQNSQVMMVKNAAGTNIQTSKSSGKLKKLNDIADKTVGVYAGTVFDGFVMNKFPKADIKRYNSTPDMILALKTGKVDVAFFDLYSSHVIMKSNDDIGLLDDNALNLPMGYGFSKTNPELRKKFNAFLSEIKSNGKFDKMYDRWFKQDPEKTKMPDFPDIPGAPTILLGVAIGDLPYSSNINGEYCGFDIELLKTFALNQKVNLKILTMDFSALVASLAAGKVDIIADGICITPERSKQVDFSDIYLYMKTGVVALKSNMGIGTEEKSSPHIALWESVKNSFYSNIILEKRYLLIFDGLKTTAIISVLSILFGTLLGGLICFMRMAKTKLFCIPAKIYIALLRGTPVLVVLMIIFYVVFASIDIDPTIVAVIAFGMNFAAYVSEMFRTGIEGVDKGQSEAGIAMGFTKLQTFILIIMPQASRRVLPVYKGEVISLVKMTSIVGYIAVQDLTKASDIIRSRTFDAFFPLIMVAVLYFLISWLLMLLLGYTERKADPRSIGRVS